MTQHEDKTLDKGTTNRLAIYCFYDPDGHAGSDIKVFLEGLVPYVRRLVIVSNGQIDDETRALFARFTPFVITRPNQGLDTAAYRQVILQIGWEQLERFDEVICCNDTCFGPIHPFGEMFDAMDARPVDFWGISAHAPAIYPGNEQIPIHVQAYWHAYRHSLVSDPRFHEYWENLTVTSDYGENTRSHEIVFTTHFADMGFAWDTYVDWRKYEGYTPYALRDMPMEVMRDSKCPVLKKRLFATDFLRLIEHTGAQILRQALDYVSYETDYDSGLIWDWALRRCNVTKLRQALHLEYILPSRTVNPPRPQRTPDSSASQPAAVRSAFIYHIFFLDLLDETLQYFANIPDETDAYITTNPEKIEPIRQALADRGITRPVTFVPVVNRGRDVSALLVASRGIVLSGDYDVVGFAHDKKSAQNSAKLGRQGTESLAFEQKLMVNTLGSKEYARNVLGLFRDNPRLGQVCPPPPSHGIYFPITRPTDWSVNYTPTTVLLSKLGVNVPLDPGIATTSAMGSCFWFRVEALRPLFEYGWTYEDFEPEGKMGDDGTISHAIERANGYVAQSQGYYPAWVMIDDYAAIEASSTNTLLNEMLSVRPFHLVESFSFAFSMQHPVIAHLLDYRSLPVVQRVEGLQRDVIAALPADKAQAAEEKASAREDAAATRTRLFIRSHILSLLGAYGRVRGAVGRVRALCYKVPSTLLRLRGRK